MTNYYDTGNVYWLLWETLLIWFFLFWNFAYTCRRIVKWFVTLEYTKVIVSSLPNFKILLNTHMFHIFSHTCGSRSSKEKMTIYFKKVLFKKVLRAFTNFNSLDNDWFYFIFDCCHLFWSNLFGSFFAWINFIIIIGKIENGLIARFTWKMNNL